MTKREFAVAVCVAGALSASACGDLSKYGFTGLQGPPGFFGAPGESGGAAGGTRADVPPDGAQPMSGSAFESLMAKVKDEKFSSNQLTAIEGAAGSNYFSAAQVGELTTLLTAASDRKRVVEICAARIIDLENSSSLTAKLTFDSEKKDAEVVLSDALAKRNEAKAQIAEEKRKAEAEAQAQREKDQAAAASAASASGSSGSGSSGSSSSGSGSSGSSSSGSSSSGSSSSASCCLGDKFNACDDAAAASACMSWGMCLFNCMSSGKSGCEDSCTEKNPGIQRCRADASRDAQCKK
jgi:hypothetical protein